MTSRCLTPQSHSLLRLSPEPHREVRTSVSGSMSHTPYTLLHHPYSVRWSRQTHREEQRWVREELEESVRVKAVR